MLLYWIWLAEHPNLTTRQKSILVQHFSGAEDIFFADGDKLEGFDPKIVSALQNKSLSEAEKILQKCAQKGIGLLSYEDERYPSRLRNIPDPPLVLYYRGTLPDFEKQPVVAVVGTRKATPYGLTVAKKLSRQIALCGGLVISGAASGNDTAAMQGALEVGKPTVGILGCGVDVVYPKSNKALYTDIANNGCLISEYPPGSSADGWHFPQRNRILSGISNGVLVTEAPVRSGALITAHEALEQGRDVFVVPANIDMPSCAGSNALLQTGALAVMTGWDVLKEYEALYPALVESPAMPVLPEERTPSMAKVAQPVAFENVAVKTQSPKLSIDNRRQNSYSGIEISFSELTPEEQQIVQALQEGPKHMDDVIAQLEMPAGKALSLITRLVVKGALMNHPGRMVSAIIRRK